MKYTELARLLREYGCYDTGEQANGHPLWYSPLSGKVFRLSNHGSQEVPRGTLRQILKDAGVKCRANADKGTPKSGWRVLGTTNINGELNVVLIHASTPECFYHARTSATAAVTYMHQRAQSYLD